MILMMRMLGHSPKGLLHPSSRSPGPSHNVPVSWPKGTSATRPPRHAWTKGVLRCQRLGVRVLAPRVMQPKQMFGVDD